MIKKTYFTARLFFTAIITLAVWGLLAWDHFHGGVPYHHILQREDLPGFSNWWGGILLPCLTWLLLYRIEKRMNKDVPVQPPINILYAFIGALLFGILLSIFFTLDFTELPFYMMVGLISLSLFFPIYRAECLLGFVVGMTFTFGGVLPMIIGSFLSLIGAVLYRLVRPGVSFLISSIINLVSSKTGSKS